MKDFPRKDFKKNNNIKFRYRINDQIRVREVRLIDSEGNQLGVVPIQTALQKAEAAGLDLIEIAAQAKPPVCKIADWDKMRYELAKKEKQQTRQKGPDMKTVQLSPNIGENDLLRKIADAQRFLDEGSRVVVQVLMRGREARFAKLAQEHTIKRVQETLIGATMEQISMQGPKIIATFVKAIEKKAEPKKELAPPLAASSPGETPKKDPVLQNSISKPPTAAASPPVPPRAPPKIAGQATSPQGHAVKNVSTQKPGGSNKTNKPLQNEKKP